MSAHWRGSGTGPAVLLSRTSQAGFAACLSRSNRPPLYRILQLLKWQLTKFLSSRMMVAPLSFLFSTVCTAYPFLSRLGHHKRLDSGGVFRISWSCDATATTYYPCCRSHTTKCGSAAPESLSSVSTKSDPPQLYARRNCSKHHGVGTREPKGIAVVRLEGTRP